MPNSFTYYKVNGAPALVAVTEQMFHESPLRKQNVGRRVLLKEICELVILMLLKHSLI